MDLSEITSLAIPDAATLGRSADAAVRMAQAFTVTSPDDYAMAAEELRAISGKLKSLDEREKTITSPLHRAHQAAIALFRGPKTALERARDLLKQSMIAWDNEQEHLQRIAQAEADRILAVERKRLADEAAAIALRAADEQRARDRAAAHAQKLADDEAARLRAVAAEALAAGNAQAAAEAEAEAKRAAEADEARRLAAEREAEAAAEITQAELAAVDLTRAVTTAPAVVQLRPTAGGTSIRKKQEAIVTDLLALVRYVAANPQFLNVLKVDDIKLRAYNTSGMAASFDGVTVGEKKILSSRAG